MKIEVPSPSDRLIRVLSQNSIYSEKQIKKLRDRFNMGDEALKQIVGLGNMNNWSFGNIRASLKNKLEKK